MHGWRSEGEVYAYFNDDCSAYAARNARRLAARLAELESRTGAARGS